MKKFKPLPFVIYFLLSIFISAQPKEVIDASKLQNSIREGNIEQVKNMIANGIDVNVQFNGRNALHTACESGSVEIVKLVLDAGANVNALRDEGEGITTLQNAIRSFKCSSEIIKLLLEKGADVNAAGQNGSLAIVDAIKKSGDKAESLKILEMLISYKTDLNPKNSDRVPVGESILHKRADMLEMLLKSGADPNVPDKNGKYAIHHAVENRDIEAVKLLKAGSADLAVKNKEGQTALDYASNKLERKGLDPKSKKKFAEIVSILK